MSVEPVPGLDSLVVGIDGSAQSAAALRWAAASVDDDGLLHVIHAIPSASLTPVAAPPLGNLGLSELESGRLSGQVKAGALLEGEWTKPARSTRPNLETSLIEGGAADALLRIAHDKGADAVVVGAHGGKRKPHFLGSVTRRLLQRSAIPTIVVRAETGDDDQGGQRANRDRSVIACIGYGEATDHAAHWAAEYAAAAGLPLTLIHVVDHRPVFPADPPEDVLVSFLGPTVGQNRAKAELENLKTEIHHRLPDLTITTKVDVAFAARGIEKTSANAGLTVLGKRHSNAVARAVLSPRIHRILTRSSTPVAVVPSCVEQ